MRRIKKLWDRFEGTQARVATLVALCALLWSVIWTITWALSQKTDIKELTKEYAEIVSLEISGLETRMKNFVEKNYEMVLDETVIKIIASHGNIERALEDVYKKAIEEGSEGGYIFEINQELGGVGSGVFVTDEFWRLGEVDIKGSSYLLTTKEKDSINSCLDSYFKEKKSEKVEDGFANEETQREIFHFLLRKSDIGCITKSPVCEIKYWTLSRDEKTEVLTPFSKLSAIIGYIGEKIVNYELDF